MGDDMAAGRRIDETVKITLMVPVDVDRQLRVLAARRGIGVGPVIREWIVEKLRTATSDRHRA